MRARRLAVVAAVLCVFLGVLWFVRYREMSDTALLLEALEGRGQIALVGAEDLRRLKAPGTELISVETLPVLARGIAGRDASVLPDAMNRARVQGLLVDRRTGIEPGDRTSVGGRLRVCGRVPGLMGVFLSPIAALYLPEPVRNLSPILTGALATVSRRILEGARPPLLSSFPEPLRRPESLEAMIMLREGEAPRLWRSARGSSLAGAVVSSAAAARGRWTERETTMGGRLEDELPELQVEVWLLQEDGSLLSGDREFVDRVVAPEHGIGFERKGTWSYLLPPAARKSGGGSAYRAYQSLFAREGLPLDSFGRRDIRLYRFVPLLLARSPAPSPSRPDRGTASPAGPPASPPASQTGGR